MMDWIGQWYDWIRAFHVLSIVTWMVGMLSLPWLFAYHCEAEPGSAHSEAFKDMERRLMRLVVNPTMTAACSFGVLMALVPGAIDWHAGWVWVKIVLILALTSMHGFLSRWRRQFLNDRNRMSARFYRGIGWSQVAMVVGIVFMVVAEPF